MRTTDDSFHLAIPVHDLDAAPRVLRDGVGLQPARTYADRITLDFLLEFKHYDDPRMMY